VFGLWTFSTLSELHSEYNEFLSAPNDDSRYFNLFDLSIKFDLPANESIKFDDIEAFPGRYNIGDAITNLKTYVPIANASHCTLLLNLSSTDSNELLGVYDGQYFQVFAPSIEDHLLDVLDGLQSNRYPYDDGVIAFGESWLERSIAKEKNLSYNIEGELLGKESLDIFDANTQDQRQQDDIDEIIEWYEDICSKPELLQQFDVPLNKTITGYQTYKRSALDRDFFDICWEERGEQFVAFVHYKTYDDIPSQIRPFCRNGEDVELAVKIEKRSDPNNPKSNPGWDGGSWLEVTEVSFLGTPSDEL